jgi:hypothetical protein
MENLFPPPLVKGNRVWTTNGYRDHGPLKGPNVDIPPAMGGVIVNSRIDLPSSDHLLFTIRWDNDQSSIHYTKQLFCIGRFASIVEFEAAIELECVTLSVGPNGGFRKAEIRLRYDGCDQLSNLSESNISYWVCFLDRIADRQGVKISTIALPRSPSKKDPS